MTKNYEAIYNETMNYKHDDSPEYAGYGKLEYEYSDAKTMLDISAQVSNSLETKIGIIYLFLVLFGMIAWFLYSLITHIIADGLANALLLHIMSFIILLVIILIIILSISNKWSEFTRFALKHNLVDQTPRGQHEIGKLERDIAIADEKATHENAIYIYEHHIVVLKEGEKKVINRDWIKKITAHVMFTSSGAQLWLKLIKKYQSDSSEEDEKFYDIKVPHRDLIILRKIFSDKFELEHEGKTIIKPVKQEFGAWFIECVLILVGIAMVVCHYAFFSHIAILIGGAFFASIGIMSILHHFSDYPLVDNGLFPFFVGILISWSMPSIAMLVARSEGVSFLEFFSTFHFNAVFVILFSMGPYAIFIGIYGIINWICHRK